jgi:hypothetical protein
MRLAERTQLGPWAHGVSDSAECEDETTCGWETGPGKMREVEYDARRHVIETGHVVLRYRVMRQLVFLGDNEP